MTKCGLCDAENPDGARFCAVRTCGAALPDELAAHAGSASSVPYEGLQAAIIGPELVVVPPGERTRIDLRVRNKGSRPEWVGARIEGLPAGWGAVEDTVEAIGSGGERLIGLRLAVPEDAGAPGVHQVDVIVSSAQRPGVAARARLLLDVPAKPRLAVRPAAERLRVRGRRFVPVTVDNDGNAPAMVTVLAAAVHGGHREGAPTDAAIPVTVACVPERVEIPAGGSATVSVRVSPWHAPAFGKAREEWLVVTARASGAEESAWLRLECIPKLAPRFRSRRREEGSERGAVYREEHGRRVRRVVRERRTSWRAFVISIVTSVVISLAATLIVASIVNPGRSPAPRPTPAMARSTPQPTAAQSSPPARR